MDSTTDRIAIGKVKLVSRTVVFCFLLRAVSLMIINTLGEKNADRQMPGIYPYGIYQFPEMPVFLAITYAIWPPRELLRRRGGSGATPRGGQRGSVKSGRTKSGEVG